MNMADKDFMLNINGKYLVRIAGEDDTIGLFKGYLALGEDTAVAIEMESGRIRFIPLAQVVYIDVLETPSAEERKEPQKSRDIYYG